jgi:hypothetical protein
MHAAELTIPAPTTRERTTPAAAIVAAVTALLLAVTGTVALAANNLRDGNGYFNSPTATFTSNGYAVAMKSVDISHAPQWALNAGLDSVRVKAHSNRALFIGIARSADLEQYLRGTEHDDVSHLNYHPFQISYDHANGHAPSRRPVDQAFWVNSTKGTGTIALTWKPRPGNWRAVVMNADGSRGVTAQLQLGARTSLLWWLGGALLAAGPGETASSVQQTYARRRVAHWRIDWRTRREIPANRQVHVGLENRRRYFRPHKSYRT